MDTLKANSILMIYNRWRRSEGKFSKPGVKCPFTPKEIGQAIDEIVAFSYRALKGKRNPTVRHENRWSWGTTVDLLTSDGLAFSQVSLPQGEEFGTIDFISVHPSVRRRGTGQTLLKFAETEIKSYGRSASRLRVEWEDGWLLDWYMKNGYRPTTKFPVGGQYELYKYL